MCKSSYYSVKMALLGDMLMICVIQSKITLHAWIFSIAIPKLGFFQYLRSERTCISKLKLLLLFVTVTFCVKILLMKLSSNCLNSHSNIPENW